MRSWPGTWVKVKNFQNLELKKFKMLKLAGCLQKKDSLKLKSLIVFR